MAIPTLRKEEKPHAFAARLRDHFKVGNGVFQIHKQDSDKGALHWIFLKQGKAAAKKEAARRGKGRSIANWLSDWKKQKDIQRQYDVEFDSFANFIGRPNQKDSESRKTGRNRRSASAASGAYFLYIKEFETKTIEPRHNALQKKFVRYLKQKKLSEKVIEDVDHIDVQYRDESDSLVLVEVKPCDKSNVRFAIRTALGQLLDYQQSAEESVKLLVVIEREPLQQDKKLAISNDFGIAFPLADGRFKIFWPNERSKRSPD